ncbi:aminotransferase class V-fold PLP-dependent enzyme [Pseudidiomarina sediminum]|uniref:aminotransferase class V-fold PLP-dependent enzyme n=1 Tax=Pseudidiomarina sediminum TaxID=431675 RepID=UPI001C959919|nr:aminotransferase class V-fold PLP-dependent enzyme [Pseudidiomarina sediminum]MBY6063646.1 aminotransferase class V-fold PLP-dependent enzyme [Pseudidiomarina sediminum]
MQRRDFLKGAAALAALPFVPKALAASATAYSEHSISALQKLTKATTVQQLVRDEVFWSYVRGFYQLPEKVIQLENGNWGVMSTPVLEEYVQQTQRVNQLSSYYSRREFYGELKPIVTDVAQRLGCGADEIAFARGASEVLNNLISGYRHLGKGDAVMYADVDYDSMQAAMRQRGVNVVKINLPEQANANDYVSVYRDALRAHPQVKLLLLTHLSHRHGLVLPIKEIVAMAREFGVDCIVDAAHSWGQMDFDLADLGADFVGFNLHKWMGAPIGCGVMYIKRERLVDIAPALGDGLAFDPNKEIGKAYHRIHTGTFNYAAWLTIPKALAFHDAIGAELKAARLRYLRDYWVSRVRDLPHLSIVADTPTGGYATITSLRYREQTSVEANKALAQRLLDQHNIFSVHRTGLNQGACVRITPSTFTLTSELDKLITALSR